MTTNHKPGTTPFSKATTTKEIVQQMLARKPPMTPELARKILAKRAQRAAATIPHTNDMLRMGRSRTTIVSDKQGPGVPGSSDIEAYGGYMVAESVDPSNARRLIACWNACMDVDTETLEQHPAPFSALRDERDQAMASIEEWHCDACRTVFLRGHVKGLNLSCQCGTGTLRPSSPNQRKAEAERDALLAELQRIASFKLGQFMGPNDMALECVTIAKNAIAAKA